MPNRRARVAALSAVFIALAQAGGCQEAEDRPPLLGRQCPDGSASCVPPPSSGAGGSGGAPEGGPLPDAAEDATRTVRGTIVLFDDDGFASAQLFTQFAIVSAEGAMGARVSTQYDGVEFVLEGVRVSAENWFLVEPGEGADALPTLEPLDTAVDPVQPALVRASVLDLVYGVLSQPASVDASAGHVLLRFFDPVTNTTVSGVSVATAQASFVAYAEGGTWSDISTSTGAPGLAVLGNVAAVPPPGSRQTVAITGVATGTVEVVVARGAVTLADIPIDG